MKAKQPAIIIGWREYVAFPEWNIKRVKCKIDTGARTSALDVVNLVELPGDVAQFDVVMSRGTKRRLRTVEAPILRRSKVRSSLGHPHDRLVVAATVMIGPVSTTIELGLVNRRNMLCRMLLGRSALVGHFLVDPHRIYVFGRKPVKRKQPDGTAKTHRTKRASQGKDRI